MRAALEPVSRNPEAKLETSGDRPAGDPTANGWIRCGSMGHKAWTVPRCLTRCANVL